MDSLPLAVSAVELLIIYGIPIAVLVGLWLVVSCFVYVLAVTGNRPLGHDVRVKFNAQKGLPSAEGRRFSPLYVAKLVAGDNCVQAVILYRLSHFFAFHRLRPIAEAVHAFSRFLTHVDISPWAEVGPGLYVYHGLGTVIGKGTQIGERVLIAQGVTTTGRTVIGDDVTLWAGAKVVAEVSIGDRSEIGANAVVVDDVPPDSVAVGIPARVVRSKRSLSPAR